VADPNPFEPGMLELKEKKSLVNSVLKLKRTPAVFGTKSV
jgi:hypothetical protein